MGQLLAGDHEILPQQMSGYRTGVLACMTESLAIEADYGNLSVFVERVVSLELGIKTLDGTREGENL
ncbi:MAG: hypothetical protein R3C24_01745 [Cyanobacteriota/Melainabacteria group bacterium]